MKLVTTWQDDHVPTQIASPAFLIPYIPQAAADGYKLDANISCFLTDWWSVITSHKR